MRVKLAWKKRNSDNAVYLVDNPVGISNISVGPFSYGPIRVVTSAANPRIQIGTFCSIASNVTLVTDNEHPLDCVSTFPFKVFVLGLPVREATGKGGIVIDDDVWIGYGATILDGVHIGRGGVIAAGAVVTRDVEPYTIVGGVPAKPIKKRFSKEVVDRLLKLDYSKVDRNFVETHLNQLYRPLDENVLAELLDEPGRGNEL